MHDDYTVFNHTQPVISVFLKSVLLSRYEYLDMSEIRMQDLFDIFIF